ncbi:MAG: hypothetical protein ACOC1L_05280 [Bacillota bacterium]
MPKSKKRKKNPNQEETSRPVRNPLKKKWGRIVVVLLVFGFLLGTVAATIFALIEIFKAS